MDDKARKPDAEEEAPRPMGKSDPKAARDNERDGTNEADRTDDGRAIAADDLNSANDE